MKQYDSIIIGFGKGGKTLAAELAKLYTFLRDFIFIHPSIE